MIDFGFDKLALIGAVALIVIGPERLPRVARTVGTLVGKAQRYVSDVKAEVNRSIELEELQRMKRQFETAAHDAGRSFTSEVSKVGGDLQSAWKSGDALPVPADIAADHPQSTSIHGAADWGAPPAYRPPRKNWRLKRGALPQWYRREQGVRSKVQSGAARVARHRPLRAR